MGHKFNPWPRKIPHAVGQLSMCVTTTESMGCNYWCTRNLEPVFLNKSQHNEKPAHHIKEEPSLAATRENLHAATKTHSSQKEINIFKK